MMSHHLPNMPQGQPPVSLPRRPHDMPYSPGPPNMRSPPAYMGYPHPQATGPLPPYAAHQYQHWYPYQQMQPPLPPPPPQRHYHAYNAPMIVSSYPHTQPILAPTHILPPSVPLPPSTATPPALRSAFSPPPPQQMPNIPDNTPDIPPSNVSTVTERVKPVPIAPREAFSPPLPWLSVPDAPFPERPARRRRKARMFEASALPVEFPAKESQLKQDHPEDFEAAQSESQSSEVSRAASTTTPTAAAAPVPAVSEPQTPVTSHPPSENGSTHPTTPSSAVPSHVVSRAQQVQPQMKAARPAVPLVPVVPILPQSPNTTKQDVSNRSSAVSKKPEGAPSAAPSAIPKTERTDAPIELSAPDSDTANKVASPPRAVPKSWADLVRTKGAANSTTAAPISAPSGPEVSRSESLADALSKLGSDVSQFSEKIAFVEPRGLVNTGNMCYMNSVLQILVFCVPFYEFLDHIGRRAAHSFRSDLPLIDAMIMFMKEFRVIDAASSPEQLKLRLKQNELEQYGDAFVPEYVYEVIRHLPRFRDMQRGHQQDAQEFLGFLLEELHEECYRALKSVVPSSSDASDAAETDDTADGPATDGWLEVGHKQKAAVTRSSGHMAAESPITRIFGGKIRSEFRVPGNKNSVTLEPYQPLQLDIGSPQVNNIVDALRNLTKPETMQGDFNSARGPKVTATKQIFIETLPPVLILHLKRFHYDSASRGVQKIWKKIGYPLELEIPKEAFPPHRRNAFAAQSGLPKYRLTGIIYHHGKNATGGHYTVDVRRQDGREWIRLDDTVIRRVRPEDVANAGSEEDPKALAAALEQHRRTEKSPHSNIYDQFDQDANEQESEKPWSQVNGTGSSHSAKKSTSAAAVGANGTGSPAASGESSGKRTPVGRYGAWDNKVAYLLFYQKI